MIPIPTKNLKAYRRMALLGAKLEANPYPPRRPRADTKKLAGTRNREDAYRLRIGPWRAIYAIRGDMDDVRIFERKRDSTYD